MNARILKKDDEMNARILKKDDEIRELREILNEINNKLNPLLVLSKPSCREVFNNITERYIKEAKTSLHISNHHTTQYEFKQINKELKKKYKTINWYEIFKLRDERNEKTHRQPLDRQEVESAISIYESNNWKNLEPMYKLSLLWLSQNP
jgi:hypothetical protein